MFNVLDLFAGCGGLSAGFEQAGFKVVIANEFWQDAAKTYALNHPNTQMLCEDITNPNTKNKIYTSFENITCDVIIGGPPCQAYSNAGLRDPNDPRGKLFEDYVEIVQTLQPKLFVMENVKGLLTMKHYKNNLTNSETNELSKLAEIEQTRLELLNRRKQFKNNPQKFAFTETDELQLKEIVKYLSDNKDKTEYLKESVIEVILQKFAEIGYQVKYKVLNAANYGVPQKRERIIFIGLRKDLDANINFPPETHSANPLDMFSPNKWMTVQEAIGDLADQAESQEYSHIFTDHSAEFTEKIKNTPIGKSVFGGYSDAFFRAHPHQPARTVKENHGGVMIHYKYDRVMTPRELARLQSFADSFKFYGTKSSVLKQIGNAVPPQLAFHIAQAIAHILSKAESIIQTECTDLQEVI
ncbi:MAG: DNA cytosine methyltransferase [Microscillaceae bacterium]|jgi:DNA (cytosine-5)-methyltransferase 1|nr:DNA cytosine methyltransferase [Microscillaceae bacterium]